jgi:integrase
MPARGAPSRRDYMASIKKREDGRWRARYRDPAGREHAKHFDRKIDAERWLDSVRGDLVRGAYVDPVLGRTTFENWAKHVDEVSVARRPTTRSRDSTLMKTRVLPTFGARSLATITNTEVKAWVARLDATGLAPATVRKCYQLLARVMGEAVESGFIAVSPCRRVALPRAETQDATLLTPEQVAALANAIRPRYRALVLCAAYTGLRWGELAGLEVGRVDFLRRRIDVASVLIEVNGELSLGAPPKTKASRSTVSVPVPIIEVLGQHVAGYPDPDTDRGLMFTSEDGSLLRRSNFRRRIWQPALRDAELPKSATFHDLRHACASWLIHAGANPLEVAQKLRHTKVTTTLSVYGHLFEGTDARLDGLLEEAFAGAGVDFSRTSRGLTGE